MTLQAIIESLTEQSKGLADDEKDNDVIFMSADGSWKLVSAVTVKGNEDTVTLVVESR